MIQHAIDTYRFRLARASYRRASGWGWLLCVGLLVGALVAMALGALLWTTYSHTFTLYVKWQDALVILSWSIAFICLGGSICVARFLYALRAGYRESMLTLVRNRSLTVRDLSAENFVSVLWMMNSAFWCFVAVLVGLLPEVLIQWTLHLSNLLLAILTTALAVVLGIAGLALSLVAVGFIVLSLVGVVSFCRKLGAPQTYELGNRTVLHINRLVLTIMSPGKQESIIDLKLLDPSDRATLLSLLSEYRIESEQEEAEVECDAVLV